MPLEHSSGDYAGEDSFFVAVVHSFLLRNQAQADREIFRLSHN
jgi:hypothetical protein